MTRTELGTGLSGKLLQLSVYFAMA